MSDLARHKLVIQQLAMDPLTLDQCAAVVSDVGLDVI
jgi:hypothetical protein